MENFQQINIRHTKFGNAGVSSLLFDDTSDIIWVGDQKGRVSSYSGPALNGYVSYIGSNNSPVHQFLNHNQGVLSLGKDCLKLTNKHGFPKFAVGGSTPPANVETPKDFKNFRTMCYRSASQSSVILGGETNQKLIDLDLNKLKVNSTIPHSSKVSVLKSSNKHLLVGNANGSLDILDTSSNNSIVKSFQAHQQSFSKVDIQNFTLVTTGYSKRHNYGNVSVVDPLINVYDLRYLKPLAPVSFPAGASFVSLHPKVPNMCFACSSTGQLQFIDLFNIKNFKIYQVNLLQSASTSNPAFINNVSQGGTRIVKMELSNSGDYLTLADNFNNLYLWSADNTSHFNNFSKPVDYPVEPDYDRTKAVFNINDMDKPLNSVGMPYYKESLLSNWPDELIFKVGALPRKIPNELIRNSCSTKKGVLTSKFRRERTSEVELRFSDYNKSKYGPRNQVQNWYSLDSNDKKNSIPKFISEKHDGESHGSDSESDEENGTNEKLTSENPRLSQIFEYRPSPTSPLSIPPAFSKLHILYSKFGIEDFDFKFYNRSKKKFSGLEIDIQNSYCNSLLILYRFVPEIYTWITQSLTKDPFIYEEDLEKHHLIPDTTSETRANKIQVLQNPKFSQQGILGVELQPGKSLLLELGYLFDMIANSRGKNCRTTNFQNILCSIPEASRLGLIDNNKKSYQKNVQYHEYPESANDSDEYDRLKRLIHSFNRFLMERLSYDERRLQYTDKLKQELNDDKPINFGDIKSSNLDNICGVHLETEVRSTSCTNSARKTTTLYTLDINTLDINDTKNPLSSSHNGGKSAMKNILYSSSSNYKGKNLGKYGPYGDPNSSSFLYNQSILPYIDNAMNNHSYSPIKTWCAKCHKYQPMDTNKTVRNLPHILSLNLNLDNDREVIRRMSLDQMKEIANKKPNNRKRNHHWLVDEFYARLSNSSQRPILKLNQSDFNVKNSNKFSNNNNNNYSYDVRLGFSNLNVGDADDDRANLSSSSSTRSVGSTNSITNSNSNNNNNNNNKKKNNNEIVKYELIGFICEILNGDESSSHENRHLVTFVKVKNGQGENSHQWYLFNDFLIMPIDEIEVFNLSYWWKKPLIVLYQSNKSTRDFQYKIDKSKLDTQILYRDYFAHGTREGKRIEYELLTQEEAPQTGTLVALDAEFVILESDKYEIRSDGTKVLVKPKRQSLARVSVVRGNDGPKKGVPFIDDYIVVEEPIEDYITSYSGIEKGDLDPYMSKKSLTYLEVAYRKLWLLLQIGVIFVGHGLANDFRAINIQVPEDQVRDTLILYSKKEVKRKLGLKFLTYMILGKNVQTGNHNSIEDARSALDLYDKYLELVKENKLKDELDRVYLEGARTGFKVPNS